MKRFTITITLIIFFHFSLLAADKKYLVTVSAATPVTVTRNKPCTKKVKVRRNGRWVYIKKRSRCPVKVKVLKRYILKKIIKADSVKEAKEEAKDYYEDEDYKGIRIIKVRLLK
jgi:hypothetical protein